MTINVHLNFDGRCSDALKFYEKALGAKITFKITWAESPMAAKAPKGWADKVMHATFEIAGQTVMAADAPPPQFQKPQGFAVSLNISDPKEAEKVFKALSEKATVTMPIAETFWAQRFGMLTDQFGTPWMVNCGKPQ